MAVVYKLASPSGLPINILQPNTTSITTADSYPSFRCPHCMHMGTFTPVLPDDFLINHVQERDKRLTVAGHSTLGLRSCPNSECRGIILVIMGADGGSICFPAEVLDFDATDIPPAIAASLEEAIKCHSSQCYKAAALMVRRALEELCDERGAKGGNLKERIVALSKVIVIPEALIQGADKLRLLGNDAAHIEAKTYESIGEPEVRISIDLAKELLKAAYQYKGLLARLAALER